MTRLNLGPFVGSHILENQIAAIQRAIAGKPLHRALQRYVGPDDGHLTERTCPFPFERMDIQENGNASVCCAHWTPDFSIGNVLADKVDTSKIYNSDQAVAMRKSVLDGSFRYCDHVKCPWIAGDCLPRKDEVAGLNARRAVETGHLEFDRPRYVCLAFDASCNLSCPSCRLGVVTEKSAIQIRKEEVIETSILPLLRNSERLNLNAAGELFVSRPLRRLLAKLNRRDFPNLSIEIITNGTLLTPREWAKFPGIHDMVDSIRISTDGATKPTFERLRRGARWEPFLDNMRFLATLLDQKVINLLQFSMTYQRVELPRDAAVRRSLPLSAPLVAGHLREAGELGYLRSDGLCRRGGTRDEPSAARGVPVDHPPAEAHTVAPVPDGRLRRAALSFDLIQCLPQHLPSVRHCDPVSLPQRARVECGVQWGDALR